MIFLRRAVWSGVAFALLVTTRAHALPKISSIRAPIVLTDGWDRDLDLAHIAKPLLVIYEDKNDGFSNQPVKDELIELDKVNHYRRSILQIYVVDLTPWDYWPARGVAKNELQKWTNKLGIVLYSDFTDSVRTTMGFTKALSNVFFYDKSGALLFGYAGPLPADKKKELLDLVRAQTPAP